MQLGAMPILSSSDIDETIIVRKMGEVTAGDLDWKNSMDDRIKSLERQHMIGMLAIIILFVMLLSKKWNSEEPQPKQTFTDVARA